MVLSLQAGNSLFPAPSDRNYPSSRSRGGVGRGALSHRSPILLMGWLMEGFSGWTDWRTKLPIVRVKKCGRLQVAH